MTEGPTPPAERRQNDFRAARIGAIAVLVSLIFVLGVQDSLSTDYHLDTGTLATLVVAILGLAGVEVTEFIKGGRS